MVFFVCTIILFCEILLSYIVRFGVRHILKKHLKQQTKNQISVQDLVNKMAVHYDVPSNEVIWNYQNGLADCCKYDGKTARLPRFLPENSNLAAVAMALFQLANLVVRTKENRKNTFHDKIFASEVILVPIAFIMVAVGFIFEMSWMAILGVSLITAMLIFNLFGISRGLSAGRYAIKFCKASNLFDTAEISAIQSVLTVLIFQQVACISDIIIQNLAFKIGA